MNHWMLHQRKHVCKQCAGTRSGVAYLSRDYLFLAYAFINLPVSPNRWSDVGYPHWPKLCSSPSRYRVSPDALLSSLGAGAAGALLSAVVGRRHWAGRCEAPAWLRSEVDSGLLWRPPAAARPPVQLPTRRHGAAVNGRSARRARDALSELSWCALIGVTETRSGIHTVRIGWCALWERLVVFACSSSQQIICPHLKETVHIR